MRFEEWEIGYAVRHDLDLASWNVIDGTEEFVALLRHDDGLGRKLGDPADDVALDGRRIGEHGVKRGDDRHFEAGQQLEDVSAGLAAKNPVLVLQANDVEMPLVQKLGGLDVLRDRFVVDLEAHGRRIVVAVAGVRHRDDASLQLRANGRDRLMKVMGEGRDSAAAGQMIADEGNAPERAH